MATNVFLGLPSQNIVKWIKDNYKPDIDIDMTNAPLHFTATEDNSSVSLVCFDGMDTYDFMDSWCKLDYSMDGKSWNTYIDPGSEPRGKIINLNKGETVYFRASLGNEELNPNLNGFSRGEYGMIQHYFVMEGSVKADGNIQFLLENTGTKMDVPAWCYFGLFKECASLTQAPTLPATILANGCYYFMFYHCTSLTQAPALPATTLTNLCYNSMFQGCTNLNSIDVNFSDWGQSYETGAWVQDVSSSGTFTCPAGLPEEFGEGEFEYSRIPTGWTVVRK